MAIPREVGGGSHDGWGQNKHIGPLLLLRNIKHLNEFRYLLAGVGRFDPGLEKVAMSMTAYFESERVKLVILSLTPAHGNVRENTA